MFDFKKNKKEEPEVKTVKNTSPDVAAGAKFSGRMSGVFGKMYRFILSVSLQQNVCQVESGDKTLFGKPLPDRFYYTNFINEIAAYIHPDDRDRLLSLFEPNALCLALSDGINGVSQNFCIAYGKTTDNEGYEIPDFKYYEFRADRIPDNGEYQTRCVLFIREIDSKEYSAKPIRVPGFVPDSDISWNDIRINTFFGGNDVVYFEYNIAEDKMYVHNGPSEEAESSVIKNYLRNMEARADWTLSHSDVYKFQKLLANAMEGIHGSDEVRYRQNGDKSKQFRYYRVDVAPAGNSKSPEWIIGTLTDIDDEVKARNTSRDISSYMNQVVGSLFSNIFELDIDKDRMYQVHYTENGFVKDENPIKLSGFINHEIESGVIHEDFVNEYKKWLEPGYLEHQALKGTYEIDTRLQLPGSLDYRWYSETISLLSGNRKFLRVRRDIQEMQDARKRDYDLKEQDRYNAYNRKVLDLMSSLVEFRNVEFGTHITQVRNLTRILLEDVEFRSPLYELTPHIIDLYVEAATMHDIGKIVVPDMILNKEGRYTPEERAIMQRHTTDGAKIIDRLELPGQEDLIACCRDVALHHHERFDGNGYPDGLVGEEIPIGVQAMGLADAYDALVSSRCYKEGFSHEEAERMILSGECGVFNPKLLESFKHCKEKMLALYIPPVEEDEPFANEFSEDNNEKE